TLPRVDVHALVVDELAVAGLTGELERLPEGRWRIAGFELRPRPAAPAPPAPAPVDEDATDAALPPLPHVEVRSLGVGVERFAIFDRVASASAPPFVVEALELTQPWPFSLTHEARASAFFALVGSGRVPGVVERAQVQLQVLPFDSEPHAALEL